MRQLILAVCLSGSALLARAGSPLSTEDAAILDPQVCELEQSASRATSSDDLVVAAQASCGMRGAGQWSVILGRDTVEGNFAGLLGKTALLTLSEQRAGLAIAYGMVWQASDAHAPDRSVQAKLALTIARPDWLLHANAGWVRTGTDPRHVPTWNLAAERLQVRERLDLMAEILGDRYHDPWLQLAARWALIPERVFFNLSVGIQLDHHQSTFVTSGLHFNL